MDELTAPLGQSRAPRRRFSAARSISIGLGVVLVAGVGVWFALAKGLLRDKPAARPAPQRIQAQVPPAKPPASADPTGSVRAAAEAAGRRTVTIIDGMSGKRQEVVIGVPEPAPGVAAGQQSR